MAIGTITVATNSRKMASAPLGCVRLTFLGDGAYPTGGTADFQASVRTALGRDVTVIAVSRAGATGVYTPVYDKANDKLFVYKADQTEVANATDLSGTTFNINVWYE